MLRKARSDLEVGEDMMDGRFEMGTGDDGRGCTAGCKVDVDAGVTPDNENAGAGGGGEACSCAASSGIYLRGVRACVDGELGWYERHSSAGQMRGMPFSSPCLLCTASQAII